ncbi:MAG: putative folate metabolism gamma-glutamate ligase [Clostridiaceae bacterium]|nr:putative folate metabolism gamma-glutamate ligase [Clostridiaceae bacterium]
MKVTAVKTKLLEANKNTLTEVLAESIDTLTEGSVVAISSKVVSLCEGNVLSLRDISKDELIKKEADCFIPKEYSKYGVYLTIKNGMLVPSAGVDESNTNGYYVMWPKEPQKSANYCWEFLREKFGLKKIGVIITDSTTSPLKWGVTGKAIAHCGFAAINSKIGENDLFKKTLRQTRINIADGLAASAVLCMGESVEQTPVAIIEDVPFVNFQDRVPTEEELKFLRISIKDDLYAPLLENAPWKT